MVRDALSDDHLIQLKVNAGTLNAQKYQDEILESGVKPPLHSLDGQYMVLRDDIAIPHCTCIIEEYKNQQNIARLPRQSLLPELNPIEHWWATSADVFETGNQPYQNHREWILCLERMYPVNLMMKMCQVVIRQCEGYTQH